MYEEDRKENKDYTLHDPYCQADIQYFITADEFDELKKAREFLLDYMHFEETILQLLLAIEDFEKFLLTSALKHYLFSQDEFKNLQVFRLEANVKALNYLNALTSIKWQFPAFKSINNDSKVVNKKFNDVWEERENKSIAFSFCQKLRNYAQHQQQTVSLIEVGGRTTDNKSLEYSASVYTDTVSILRDERSNNKLLKKRLSKADKEKIARKRKEEETYLEYFGERADVALVFRETTAELAHIINSTRVSLSHFLIINVDIYKKYLDMGHSKNNKQISIVFSNNDAQEQEFEISSVFLHRIESLSKMYITTNNSNIFISNRIKD